ncbi:MAG: hypothetical protein EZS28_028487, partial [Streblomastix strix]
MKIYGNTADRSGQSLYVVMKQVREWCRYGVKGEYVKGNYSDATSVETDLEGIPLDWPTFTQQTSDEILNLQRKLEAYWSLPTEEIWHILDNQQQFGNDSYWCGEYDDQCKTIEFVLNQISFRKGGSVTAEVDEKKIGITEGGYYFTIPYQFSPTSSHAQTIKIMKQLFNTTSAMKGNAQIKFIKEGKNEKETGQFGWIQAKEGINLGIYGIDIQTDVSIFAIPLIYIDGTQSQLELDTISISEINFSPKQDLNGVIHIIDNSKFTVQKSVFSDVNIIGIGGNIIRLKSSSSTLSPITATVTECEFKNIQTNGDSFGVGGAAIYSEIGQGGSLKVIGPSIFTSCVSTSGDGGAIYTKLEKDGQFIIDGKVQFSDCNSIQVSNRGGRGGSLYLNLSQDSTYNFTIGKLTQFSDNKASLKGRDFFIYCWNIITMNVLEHILFDVDTSSYNKTNALYGTEYEPISSTHTEQLINYDLTLIIIPDPCIIITVETSILLCKCLTEGDPRDECKPDICSSITKDTPISECECLSTNDPRDECQPYEEISTPPEKEPEIHVPNVQTKEQVNIYNSDITRDEDTNTVINLIEQKIDEKDSVQINVVVNEIYEEKQIIVSGKQELILKPP